MPSESSRHEPLLVGGELIQALADRIGDPNPVHGYAELPVDVAEQLHQYQLLNTVRNIRLRRSPQERLGAHPWEAWLRAAAVGASSVGIVRDAPGPPEQS